MKYFLILSFLSAFTAAFHKVAEMNRTKEEAEAAYKKYDFKKSAALYEKLISDYPIEDEHIRINLAHSFFKTDERKKAEKEYLKLTSSTNSRIKAIAFQQLGVLMGMRGKYQSAIDYFIQSLKTDPFNEKARYNYEMIKKLLDVQFEEENEKSQKADRRDRNKNEKGKAGKDPGSNQVESKNKLIQEKGKNQDHLNIGSEEGDLRKESEEGTEKKGKAPEGNGPDAEDKKSNKSGNESMDTKRARRLSQVNLNEEKARVILETMKNEEVQYLQQIRKNTSSKEYKNKPDW